MIKNNNINDVKSNTCSKMSPYLDVRLYFRAYIPSVKSNNLSNNIKHEPITK